MGPVRTRWVLCSGATHPAAPADALRLGTGPGPWHPIRINIVGLEAALTGSLAGRWRDLIRLASMVLAADCATSRGTLTKVDNGESWRRSFRFVVPVREPEFWNQTAIRRTLQETVGFLSDDHYRFEFVPGDGLQIQGPQFLPATNGRTFYPWDHIDEVALFSGGMDSFAGAAEATLVHGRKVLLVTRRSSTKMLKVQRELVDDLRRLSGSKNPWHVELGVEMKGEGRTFEQDTHQRSRSFLFASIAGAVASLVGVDGVRFYENGIIAINAPISPQLTGAQATRTVHPKVVAGFSTLLGLVGDRPLKVENPYQDLTRADVALRIRDAGAIDLLKYTRSCASVRNATVQHPHCGVCSQCVDRRFAVRAAGMAGADADEAYEIDLFKDALGEGNLLLPVGYVNTAYRMNGLSRPAAFLQHYPEVATALPGLQQMWGCAEHDALDRLWNLHQRQASGIVGVLEGEVASRAGEVLTGQVHPHSLLGRCLDRGADAARRAHGIDDDVAASGTDAVSGAAGPVGTNEVPDAVPQGTPLARNTFKRVGKGWMVGLQGSLAKLDKHRRGYVLIAALLRAAPTAIPTLVLDRVGRPGAGTTLVQGGQAPPPSRSSGSKSARSVHTLTDPQALAAYRARLDEISAEIAEAEEMTDLAEVERLKTERENIARQISADTGLGGRPRQTHPDAEKARNRIRKSIRDALRHLKEVDKPLGIHLQASIDKGAAVHRYTEGAAEDWDL